MKSFLDFFTPRPSIDAVIEIDLLLLLSLLFLGPNLYSGTK